LNAFLFLDCDPDNSGYCITFTKMSDAVHCMLMVLVIGTIQHSLVSCKSEHKPEPSLRPLVFTPDPVPVLPDFDTTSWQEMTNGNGFYLDIKYATTENFTGAVIYPCGRFFLRPVAAHALIHVRDELQEHGYGLKLFDGYRPQSAQQKLWDKVPNKNYVAPPSTGSMHSRGIAVDLTLADSKGNEMNMGTPYDFFGPEAHRDFTDLAPEILSRRKLLRRMMEKHGFQSIRTEWWHFSFVASYPLDEWQWTCKD
jgi:D-alanyl-D-alanine dipeptidase